MRSTPNLPGGRVDSQGVDCTTPEAVSLSTGVSSSEHRRDSGLPSRGFGIATAVEAENKTSLSPGFNGSAVQLNPHQNQDESSVVNPEFLTSPPLTPSNSETPSPETSISYSPSRNTFQANHSSLKSARPVFVGQQNNVNPTANARVPFMTSLGLGPKQSYNPTMNTGTQESLYNLNFDEWLHDDREEATPCPGPRGGETSMDQDMPFPSLTGSLSSYFTQADNLLSPTHQSDLGSKDPDLSQAAFDMLVDSNELLPELPVPPGLSRQAEPTILEKR
ncbi:hypothetical protein GX50_06180 [[Emmonsia] crescens]|uniref:Uncharacterized protein n=1 Tax=[Emmonsia] crescens TaxID=73230 RepID=A0A2B7ZDI0_9EURO|nr:hypothetical protein GX50_06180 [Emmonsia crescens]